MGQFNSPPALEDWFRDVKLRLQSLENAGTPSYTVATRPTAPVGHPVVFVSDAAAGANFQGWTGSAWVSLG